MKLTAMLGTAAVLATMQAWAQTQSGLIQPAGTSPPLPNSPGLLNQWLREQSPEFSAWDLGGQFRARFEHKEDMAVPGLRPEAVDFRRNGGADNDYLLLREKIHLGYTPVDWLTAYVEARDSSANWDRRRPSPESDVFDLNQAYVKLGNAKEFPLTLKVGRQELIYGDERLIGTSDWNNIGRVFDAAKLRYEIPDLWVDAFVSRVVIPYDGRFNVANDYDWFSGLYGSTTKLLSWQETQLYFLSRNVGNQSPDAVGQNLPAFLRGASPRDIYTLGARIKSLPGKLSGWDYEAELAGQFGNFRASTSSPRLEQEAFAGHVAGGYTWTRLHCNPRVGLEYNYSSGDSDPRDNKHETFDNLFPTNHKFYGFMDFFSWQNIHDLRLSTSVKPAARITVTGDFHAFWLADTHDFFYQVNGAPRTTGGYGIHPDAGNFVGTELDLVATWSICKFAALQAGYGHFFVGEYVRDSLQAVGGAADANWVYAQAVLNF